MIIDLFAGGGGASLGIEAATGRHVDVAINHSATALAVHAANHPRTKHLTTDIWEVDPKSVTRGRKVELLWASPDCTHFSVAKGGKPVEKHIRSLAWVVVEWARAVRPACIFLENVAEFRTWGPLGADDKPDRARMGETFNQWRGALELLGYTVDHRILDASLYGAPTKRKRLFLVARCDGRPIRWPEPTHGPGLLPLRTAAECVDWSLPCPSIFERAKPLAVPTLARIVEGLKMFVFDNPAPFLVDLTAPLLVQTGYGERQGQRPRALNLHEPLGTVMGGGVKHAVVSAWLVKHYGGSFRKRPGSALDEPVSTITARDHHSLAVAPLNVGSHEADVRSLLRSHGVRGARPVFDIGLRMLQPHELLKAQFGRFAEGYDMSAAVTAGAKVKLIGNSVAPEVAEALIRANVSHRERRAA